MNRIFILVLLTCTTACSTFQENTSRSDRLQILGYSAVGTAVGALVGGLASKDHKPAYATLGGALGGLTAAATTTLLVGADKDEGDIKFMEQVIQDQNKAQGPRTGAVQIVPKDLPNEIQNSLKAPQVVKGKTGWFELDGRIYAPTDWFEYNEGALKVPKLKSTRN